MSNNLTRLEVASFPIDLKDKLEKIAKFEAVSRSVLIKQNMRKVAEDPKYTHLFPR